MSDNGSTTERQKQVFQFFEERSSANLPPPTYGEIAERFGWRSRNAAKRHVLALRRKGLLKQHVEGGRRGTSLARPQYETRLVEKVGGKPVADLVVPPYMLPPQGVLFAFRMPDSRAQKLHIVDKDLVFVGPVETPVSPRVVVVAEKGRPVVATSSRPRGRVLGVVVGLMRSPASVATAG